MKNMNMYQCFFAIIAGLIVYSFFIIIGKNSDTFHQHPSHIRILASEYVPNAKCFPKKYKNFQEISIYCADNRYKIINPSEYNLDKYGSPFYRVGDDIYQLRCDSDSCVVRRAIYNSYYSK